jgi:nitrogen fixation protein FixH
MIKTTVDGWRHFPRYLILAMGVVMAVNVRFIYFAVTTFPGEVGQDEFGMSNHYDSVLAAKAAQDSLGWTASLRSEGMTPLLHLAGPDGRPLAGAVVTAQAERPIGTDAPLALGFTERGLEYTGVALPAGGQWDLRLIIRRANQEIRITRRLIIQQ